MEEEIFKVYKQTRQTIWEVSNFGRVKKNGEIYNCRKNINGYLVFGSHYLVHRAVAELFIPNTEGKTCVDHIDTNILNNHYKNLRWVTYSENNLNPITRKRSSEAKKGEKNGMYGKKSPMYGKKHSLESRMKMSKVAKGKYVGEKNPMYGRDRSGEKNGMYGKQQTEKSKQNNSNWHKGRHIVLCEDGKRHWV